MGTRSNIIAKVSDNRWGRIYVHWDGYPDHHGPILLDHYAEQVKIDALIALGDLSSLAEEIGVKHNFDDRPDNACTAYGRDRGEKGVEAAYYGELAEALDDTTGSGAEFVYVWNGQSCSVGVPEDVEQLHPLWEFMKGNLTLKQTVKAFGGDFVIGKRTARAARKRV